MAYYYSSDLYKPNDGEYNSGFSLYGYNYDFGMIQSHYSYSSSSYSEPQIIHYDPNYDGCYNEVVSQFVISYSTLEVTDADFIEYDPTPYEGGFDIVKTYGNPLPPSDEICYPRLVPPANKDAKSPNDTKKEVDHAAKPMDDGKVIMAHEEDEFSGEEIHEKILPHEEDREPSRGDAHGNSLELDKNEEPGGTIICDDNDNSYLLPGYGNGRSIEEYGYEYQEKQMCEMPSGYGLEAVDLCEGLFGYWPCLSKKEKKMCDFTEYEDGNVNQWKGASDYLFGYSYPYGDRREEGYYDKY